MDTDDPGFDAVELRLKMKHARAIKALGMICTTKAAQRNTPRVAISVEELEALLRAAGAEEAS